MINVLIAEDNAAYRGMLHQVLMKRFPFMQITDSADGTDALHQALARRYDLIFMDIRLPQGNGLDLTRAIKAVFVDSVICVLTSYDLPEYREAAIRNGADRFMLKDESTGDEIVAVVEALLATRYRTLVMVNDAQLRRQLATLLSIRWPLMIVVEAMDAEMGLDHAALLNPDMVLLELGQPGYGLVDLVQKARRVSPQAVLVGMADEPSFRASALGCGIDYCVPLTPMGHTELVAIVASVQPKPARH